MLSDGEINLNGHGTMREPASVVRRCLRCHCCLISSILDCYRCRRCVLQCTPRRLYSSSQGNTTVQQNPYIEQQHSAYEVPESSNVQGVHHHYDYKQFGQQFGEPVPMSIGTNVAGRNHDGSLDDKHKLTPSSDLGRSNMFIDAPSGGLQQRRDMSNWSHSSLQVDPQTQLGPSGGLQQHRDLFNRRNSSLQMGPQTRRNLSSERSQQRRNMFSWRKEFLKTPPRAHLNHSSAPGLSTVANGAPFRGGPQQHRSMSNSSELSMELLRQTQLYCYFKGRASLTPGITTGLEQHGIGNMYSISNSSLQTPPWETQPNLSSGSRNRIMDNSMNYMVNQRKRRSLLTSMGASQSDNARMLIKDDDIRPAKRPCSLWAPENYCVGSWNRNTSELGSNHCAFINNTATQNLEQINSATVLEKISSDLLNDIDIEPAGAAEETMVMSTINSLSSLLQGEPAPATARSSQASYAHGTASTATPLNISAEAATNQGLGVAPDAGSSGGSCSLAGGASSRRRRRS